MKPNEFDCDKILTEFLTDYLDDNLDRAERQSFEEYLARNKKERVFARKAMKGKKVLSRLADRINGTSVTA
jgi:anti-sigma factor RsiW